MLWLMWPARFWIFAHPPTIPLRPSIPLDDLANAILSVKYRRSSGAWGVAFDDFLEHSVSQAFERLFVFYHKMQS